MRLAARLLHSWCCLAALALLGALIVAGAVGPAVALSVPPTTAIRYDYDADGQLKAVVDPASQTAFYSWDPVGNLLSIARHSSTALSIIQLTPARGSVGSTVLIAGTGFSTTATSDTVKFNGTKATVSAATSVSLTVKVPTGATSGAVTVSTPTEGPVSSYQTFTVAASSAPTVTSLSTTIASPGTEVTASGSGFEAGSALNNDVAVNRTRPELISESATAIKFKVPGATGGGHVSVATPQGSATGPDLFIPPNSLSTSRVGATARVSLGSSTTVKLPTTEKVGLVLFDGAAGQRVSLALSESTINFGYASIWGPDGAKVSGNAIAPFGAGFGYKGNGWMEPVTLPSTGTYTILVEPEGTNTGNVKLTPYSVADATGSLTPTTEGAKQVVSIATPGQNALYSVTGTAGELVTVKTTATSMGSEGGRLEWLNPEGKAIESASFNATENVFMKQVKFPTAGTYTLKVDPIGPSTGSLTLTAYNAADVTGTITPSAEGESKSLTLGVPGQYARISFSGTAGERVSLAMSEATINYGYAYILNSEGVRLSGAEAPFGAGFGHEGKGWMEPVTLPASGTYTVLLEPAAGNTGSVKLSAYSVTDATGSIAPTTEGAKG